ncbi:DUF2784 domain-containing protein [Desulfoprunum benzoelyticum]|uniref:DUF2784 domain-containing protein n=1 Tax=Desulfoprunum benzoelyticum TaxID=1506996 RepID=A0A840UWZ6_9BACT|nr:DUF2784 domain-containing protein [Desulfoprunum benzoelyticum]MBB5349453.1 hypothetical protein [Desulfoprunum benzoelyticum]MBM9531466.1 DUF2784 domain-containing protein [Desulfoprunum benzoelyticum]
MSYRLLGDLVVVLHLLFILFVAAGGLLVLPRPRLALLHLPAVVWGALIEFTGGICPLTPLENLFNRLAGHRGYDGGFIDHYLLPIIYPEEMTREIQIGLGLLVVAINAALYLLLIRRSLRRRSRK